MNMIEPTNVELLYQAIQETGIKFLFLYAITILVGGKQAIKIGKTHNVAQRIREYGGQLICCWPETTLLSERGCHRRLQVLRIKNGTSRETYQDVPELQEMILGWAKPWGKLAMIREAWMREPWQKSKGETKRSWAACPTCAKMFYRIIRKGSYLYCSDVCAPAGCDRQGNKIKHERVCKTCGKQIGKGFVYCSNACTPQGIRTDGRLSKKRKIDQKVLLRLWNTKGVTQRSMARHFGCTDAAVCIALRKIREADSRGQYERQRGR